MAANRGVNVSHSGEWEFPGGKPHANEDPRQCVVRRVQEELNLNINVLDAIKPYNITTPDKKSFRMHPFLAEIVGGKVEISHHNRVEWFLPMQLMSLAWPDSDVPIIDELVGRIFRNGKIV